MKGALRIFFFFFVTSTGMESSLLGGQIREFEQALGVKPVNKFNNISLEGWVVNPVSRVVLN